MGKRGPRRNAKFAKGTRKLNSFFQPISNTGNNDDANAPVENDGAGRDNEEAQPGGEGGEDSGINDGDSEGENDNATGNNIDGGNENQDTNLEDNEDDDGSDDDADARGGKKKYWPEKTLQWFDEVKAEIDKSVNFTGKGRQFKMAGRFPKQYCGLVTPSTDPQWTL